MRYQDSVEGWSAEGYPSGVEYLQKKYVNPSTKFAIGDQVEVYNTGASGLIIRTDPPELADKGKLYDNSPGTIISGPFYGVPQGTTGCYHFWQVDYGSIVGWSAEDFLTKPTPVISARIDSYSPNSKIEVDPGQSFTISVTFTNTGNVVWDFLAGTSIWDSGNNEVVDDWSEPIGVQPGQQGSYSWTHSLNTPGEYTLQFGVWKDQSTLLNAKPSPKQNLIKVKQPAPLMPQITGVDPAQPVDLPARQPFSIIGEGFVSGLEVTLKAPDGNEFVIPRPDNPNISVTSDRIDIETGFYVSGTWQVWVTNPGDIKSNVFSFEVVALPDSIPWGLDVALVSLIEQYAPDYYNADWNISLSQFKAWIALISLREAGFGRYTAHSQYGGGFDGDRFNHLDAGNAFRFSTGIGSFQLDRGGGQGNASEDWSTMPTMAKLDPQYSLLSVLRWHRDRFGTGATLAEFSGSSAWLAVQGSKETEFASTWFQITGNSWDASKNQKFNVAFNPPTISDPIEDIVQYLGQLYWYLPPRWDGYLNTWHITARSWEGVAVTEYYYTYNDDNGWEIWVSDDAEQKLIYYFERNYGSTQYPENRSDTGGQVALAGGTASTPILPILTSLPIAKPVITSPLQITPTKAAYSVETLTAEFTITNRGSASITFDELVVGGRGPNGEVVDFQKALNISLAPGASYNYTGTRVLPNKTGIYHFFCAYHTVEHLPGEDENSWNTNINVEIDGQIVKDFSEARSYRERDIVVFESTISPAPPSQEWQEITGPWNQQISGQRINLSGIAVQSDNPGIIYAAVSYRDGDWGGWGDDLYKSVDGGQSWQSASQGLPGHTLSERHKPIGAFAIAPSDSNVVYLGTTDFSPYSSSVVVGKGVYKSIDGGAEWTPVSGPQLSGWWQKLWDNLLGTKSYYPVSSMAVDPINRDIVYVGTIGGGIWKTADGGVSWQQIWYEDIPGKSCDVNALAISPADPSTVYAAIYYYPPENLYGSGLAWEYRLVKSSDGGNTFNELPHPEIGEVIQHKIDDIAVDSKNADILFVINEYYEVYRSTDGGANWFEASGTSGNNPLPFIEPVLGAWSHSYGTTGSVSIHPEHSNVVYASGQWGLDYVYFSPNNGDDWFPLGDLKDRHIKNIQITSDESSYVAYATALGGLYKSVNISLPQEPNIGTISPIDFGDVVVGTSRELTTTISNNGTASLAISSITMSGSSNFTYISPSFPFLVTTRGSQNITIRFAPSSMGLKQAIFTVNSNDLDSPTVTFNVSGNGTAPSYSYSVSGIVRYSITPFNGVTVELVQGTVTNPPVQSTTTSNGHYGFSSVAPGSYWVKVYGPTTEYIGWRALPIEVVSGDVTKDIDLPKKMTLLSPENNATITSLHPTLSWQGNTEAAIYAIQINVTEGWQLLEVGNSSSTSYIVQHELTSGINYTWQVDAFDIQNHNVGTTQTTFRFTVSTANHLPNAPNNVSPAHGAEGISLSPTLQSSPFSNPDGGDTHAASQWQIRTTSGNYSSPVFDSGSDNVSLTQITVPSGTLNYTTTYYWHVRHQDNHGAWSNWSAETSFTTTPGQIVTFPDPNLEAAIRQAIGKPTGDIYKSDLEGLIDLDAQNKGISNLAGLEHCSNLKMLGLYQNAISDLSPISNLVMLERLYLGWNHIVNVSPISKLTNLIDLHLNSNQISDISSLSNLTNLNGLDLGTNQITNLSPISNLTTLGYLLIRRNQVSDILSLAALTNLSVLDISYNLLSDIGVLAGLTKLELLFLAHNQISDVSPLSGLTSLTTLYLQENQISDIAPLVANVGLLSGDTVDLRGNPLSAASLNTYVLQLQGRGVTVLYDVNHLPNQPTNISPPAGVMVGTLTPTLQSSIFSDSDVGDAHAASQWQIRTDSGDYSSPVFDSGTDSSHLTQITVPLGKLTANQHYYWHVRHQDNHGAWSNWSVETSFTPVTTYNLTINIIGNGTTSPAASIPITYPAGSIAQIEATAATGWQFSHWSGNATGNANPITITMNNNKAITANFVEVAVIPGDANGDGVVNALDITKVERIIAHLDQSTPGADANQDGNVNALDITKVERIIVGLD